MFKKYFPNESPKLVVYEKEKISKKSKKALIRFMRDFEILPSLININSVCEFFYSIKNEEIDEF